MAVIIFLLIAAVIVVIKIVSDKPITLWGGGEYTFNVTRLRYAQVLPLIKVGDRLKLWTKPNYSRIIINVRGYGFILEEGQLGLVPHEYVSVIQRHLLSDYPLYDAEIVNISEKSCTVKVKLLSRKEQDILNAGVKLAHELSEREERVKLTALFEKPYHANLKAKPLMVIFTLLKKDFKDFQNVKLIVMPKEFYLKNIYDIKLNLEDQDGQIIAESYSSKSIFLRVIRGSYNGYRYKIVNWEFDSYFDNRVSVYISPY